MSNEPQPPKLKLPRRLWKLAKKLMERPEQLASTLDEASQRAEKAKNKIQSVWEDLKALIRLVRSWAKGDYKEVPKATILKALFAILYFMLIVDAVPDFIPAIGLLDDASVILWILSSIRDDLRRFCDWEKTEASKTDKIG